MDDIDLYDERVQQGISFALKLFATEIAGLELWEGGDGSESVEGDVLVEFRNIAREAGWFDAGGDIVFGPGNSTANMVLGFIAGHNLGEFLVEEIPTRGLPRKAIYNALGYLSRKGQIERLSYGKYRRVA